MHAAKQAWRSDAPRGSAPAACLTGLPAASSPPARTQPEKVARGYRLANHRCHPAGWVPQTHDFSLTHGWTLPAQSVRHEFAGIRWTARNTLPIVRAWPPRGHPDRLRSLGVESGRASIWSSWVSWKAGLEVWSACRNAGQHPSSIRPFDRACFCTAKVYQDTGIQNIWLAVFRTSAIL